MDENERNRQLFQELVTMFMPHVEAVQWPKILAWARSPYDWEEKKAIFAAPFFVPLRLMLRAVDQEGSHLGAIRMILPEMVKAALHLPRLSRRHIAANKEQWLDEAARVFVRGWLSALSGARPDAALDDVMLPKAWRQGSAMTIAAYSGEQLSVEDVLAVLRAVKASLPAGQRIPPQALELVEAERRLFD